MAVTTVVKEISLNVGQPNNFELFCAMQGDRNSYKVVATLYDVNKLYDIAGTVILKGLGPNNNNIVKSVDSQTDHTVTFTLEENMLEYSGLLKLVLVVSSGGSQITTFPFVIKVVSSPGNSNDEDSPVISSLIEEAEMWANISKSYAVGTNDAVRDGDSRDNSKYYYEQIKKLMGDGSTGLAKYKATIVKDGNNTDFTINHKLGTQDIIVESNDADGRVLIDWFITDANNVKFKFAEPLGDTDKYYISIYGATSSENDDLPDKVYLYNAGDECTDITGGWEESRLVTKEDNFSLSKESNCLKITIKANDKNANGTVITNNNINFSSIEKYTKIGIAYSSDMEIGTYIPSLCNGSRYNYRKISDLSAGNNIEKITNLNYEIKDSKLLISIGRPEAVSSSNQSLYVYKIWLEK